MFTKFVFGSGGGEVLGYDKSICKLNMKLIIICEKKKICAVNLVAVQVSSCSAKGTNWSVFDR